MTKQYNLFNKNRMQKNSNSAILRIRDNLETICQSLKDNSVRAFPLFKDSGTSVYLKDNQEKIMLYQPVFVESTSDPKLAYVFWEFEGKEFFDIIATADKRLDLTTIAVQRTFQQLKEKGFFKEVAVEIGKRQHLRDRITNDYASSVQKYSLRIIPENGISIELDLKTDNNSFYARDENNKPEIEDKLYQFEKENFSSIQKLSERLRITK